MPTSVSSGLFPEEGQASKTRYCNQLFSQIAVGKAVPDIEKFEEVSEGPSQDCRSKSSRLSLALT